jgi:glycosyltransferase involved in cell wall biosynthesis
MVVAPRRYPIPAGKTNMLDDALRRARAVAKGVLRSAAPPGTARHRAGTALRRHALHVAAFHVAGALPAARTDARRYLAAANADLAAGQLPRQLGSAFAAGIARADACLRDGNAREAASWLARTGSVAFHRVVHFDRLCSPLAQDPRGFLAPLHRSEVTRALAARTRAVPAAPPPTDRPLRLLLATRTNANFLPEIRQHYEAHAGVELRFLDLMADPDHAHLTRGGAHMLEQLLAGDSDYGRAVQAWLRPHLDWADTVFVDWCVSPAVLFTMIDPGTTRLIVRLHSFEAFSLWPHLVSLGRLDDLVFVSEPMRRLTAAVLPGLGVAGAPRTWVVPNAMSLDRFVRPKPPQARFTLGLVGWAAVAKDARWAVDVLRLLRTRDSRYRLALIGAPPDLRISAAARAYHRMLEKDLAGLERQGAIQRVGHTDDVPGALTGVGVIMSSSVRESFHCAVVEGAASGAVPVVRDWPFFARTGGGAREIFPADWVVDSPEAAAERIIEQTADEETWRRAGAATSRHAVATWDWPATRPLLDNVVFGRTAPAPAAVPRSVG